MLNKKKWEEEKRIFELCIKAYEQKVARLTDENEDLKKKLSAAEKEAKKWHDTAVNIDNIRREALV